MRSWISIGGMGKWMGSQWQICKILRFSIAATPQDQGPNCQKVYLSVSTPASYFRKQQTARPSPPHLCWSGIGGGKVVIAGGGVGVGFVHLAESWDYWRPVAPPLSLLLTSATTNFSLSNHQKLIQDGTQWLEPTQNYLRWLRVTENISTGMECQLVSLPSLPLSNLPLVSHHWSPQLTNCQLSSVAIFSVLVDTHRPPSIQEALFLLKLPCSCLMAGGVTSMTIHSTVVHK